MCNYIRRTATSARSLYIRMKLKRLKLRGTEISHTHSCLISLRHRVRCSSSTHTCRPFVTPFIPVGYRFRCQKCMSLPILFVRELRNKTGKLFDNTFISRLMRFRAVSTTPNLFVLQQYRHIGIRKLLVFSYYIFSETLSSWRFF